MNSERINPAIGAQESYYNDYWSKHEQRLNTHEVARLAEVIRAISSVLPTFKGRKLRLCDLGCGRGWLSNELTKFGNVTAVDLSPVAVAAAKENWPAVNFISADILEWRPGDHFDVVISSEVIEHVPDQKKFSDTVVHLLREGGFLILTTPNGMVKGTWDASNMGQQLIENWLTRRQLLKLFRSLDVLDHRVFVLDFAYTGLFRVISAVKLHRALKTIGLLKFFDFVRESLGLGLYQILVAKSRGKF